LLEDYSYIVSVLEELRNACVAKAEKPKLKLKVVL
jgi:hypothetical protein